MKPDFIHWRFDLDLGGEYSEGMKEITRELESLEPYGALMDLLAGADLASLSDDQKVTTFILARKIKRLQIMFNSQS